MTEAVERPSGCVVLNCRHQRFGTVGVWGLRQVLILLVAATNLWVVVVVAMGLVSFPAMNAWCVRTGVQEYRSTGVQGYRSTGVQEYCRICARRTSKSAAGGVSSIIAAPSRASG